MKNTVKKILALVFVVAMVCSLAVPAFAGNDDDYVDAKVLVLGKDGKAIVNWTAVDKDDKLTPAKANVESVIEAATNKVTIKSGKVTAVDGVENAKIEGAFETASWVVALNGKIVNVDLGTVAVEEDDEIVVYWADTTFDTKLAQVDDSAIAQGIVSFFYYDAEGNKQPLTDATVVIKDKNNNAIYDRLSILPVADQTNAAGKTEEQTNAAGEYTDGAYPLFFVTDEKGQIWIAPEYLDHAATYTVASVTIEPLKKVTKDEGYTSEEVVYFNENLDSNLEAGAVANYKIVIEADMYDVAGATGDMTIVYVLVAAAAVVTLGAVVVMKKKSVKAN